MTLRAIPNIITILRITLVVPLAVLLVNGQYMAALLIFVFAGLSDGIDGYLARRNNWISRSGAILDPLADKLLMFCSYLVLSWLGKIPVWLAALVIGRDIVIVSGAIAYYKLVGQVEMEPQMVSKINTLFQILLVLTVLFSLAVHEVAQGVLWSLIAVVTVTTVWSGLSYVWTWGRRAFQQNGDQG